jgi:hypothetical protein
LSKAETKTLEKSLTTPVDVEKIKAEYYKDKNRPSSPSGAPSEAGQM